MKSENHSRALDVRAFAQSGGSLAGHDPLSKYPRLMEETKGQGAQRLISWSALGEFRVDPAGTGQVWLHLTVEASLPLTCQRCMGPADVAVQVHQSFRFVHDEATAQAQDEDAEEDVLALDPDFKLAQLIEDEVLMALPLVPRHETCPVAVKLVAADPGFEAASAEKRNPFAVLAKLQGGKSG